MKMIFKIAKTELQSLFYSPIAWLLLVVFAYQVGMIMSGMLEDIVVRQAMGYESWRVTSIFGQLFGNVQGTLYFYIPLLTMNMISRDLSGGTIKLLQSAPLRNAEIVLGKYLALMIFGLAMIRFFALILLLVELTSCSQYKSKTAEFCQLDKIDSVRCYSHFKNKEVTINDTNVLNKINNCLKRSVLHHDERFVKHPPYYGTITIFSNEDSIIFDVHGNTLKQNDDVYLECSTNIIQIINSIIVKNADNKTNESYEDAMTAGR